jgi:uncharacterized protein YdiU (UPF0061 family)
MTQSQASLQDLKFENSFTQALPADPSSSNVPRQVRGACYSRVQPTPVAGPRLLSVSREVADLLGLDPAATRTQEFADVFAGNTLLPGMDPFAMCYGGFQFGNWAGQLGDGRAINLGEVVNERGRFTLQLKGSGLTPYSRTADGRAVLRSSVREFLCSEAMHHLGVPTTRALSLVTTGEAVVRDMFYDGHPQAEPGAVVCRVAPNFLRFGNFELLASRGEKDLLTRLMDYTIRTGYPHLGEPGPETYMAWFQEVCTRTARMVVEWMRVGFVHGVMNTDNMSILGLTIDYGPYGWLEDYQPGWTPNTTDASGRRYCFGNQPQIALWNLSQLGKALTTVIPDTDGLNASLELYAEEFNTGWRTMMAAKLGLERPEPEQDEELIMDLQNILQLVETDMTLFYRGLGVLAGDARAGSLTDEQLLEPLMEAYYQPGDPTGEAREATCLWLKRYLARVHAQPLAPALIRERMEAVNPLYVLRNYLAQQAIDKAAQGDSGLIDELLEVLRRPCTLQPGKEEFARRRPEWARHRAGCSMLSCSS